ncbi:hypothetical protein QD712_25530 [Streptomyces acidiscabies]|uniref:hypothetical protein n=1 Tax=Streptomyces acidiscabies TaxID=42234 RepID=UPI0030D38B88
MNFHDALSSLLAELTPQPWDYTASDGTTLRVIPAGVPSDPGTAEVYVRLTRADATGLYEFGITGPNSRGVAEVGIPTANLPAMIQALTSRTRWEADHLVTDSLTATPDAEGVTVEVTEVHSKERQETVSVRLPESQRLPVAAALRRALEVARDWEVAAR